MPTPQFLERPPSKGFPHLPLTCQVWGPQSLPHQRGRDLGLLLPGVQQGAQQADELQTNEEVSPECRAAWAAGLCVPKAPKSCLSFPAPQRGLRNQPWLFSDQVFSCVKLKHLNLYFDVSQFSLSQTFFLNIFHQKHLRCPPEQQADVGSDQPLPTQSFPSRNESALLPGVSLGFTGNDKQQHFKTEEKAIV